MGTLQKVAVKSYDKIKAERGEVTFIDAFVAGSEYMSDKAEKWLAENAGKYIWHNPYSRETALKDFKKAMKENDC